MFPGIEYSISEKALTNLSVSGRCSVRLVLYGVFLNETFVQS